MRMLLLVLLLLPCQAFASPYFRLFDYRSPKISAGLWTEPSGGPSSYGSAVALITHSAKDGSFFGLHSDWSPLAIGGGYSNGTGFMAMGPSANLAPATKTLIVKGLDLLGGERFSNLRQLLAPVPDGKGPDISVAFGPQMLWRPIENGTCLSVDRWRGHFTFFSGAAWSF